MLVSHHSIATVKYFVYIYMTENDFRIAIITQYVTVQLVYAALIMSPIPVYLYVMGIEGGHFEFGRLSAAVIKNHFLSNNAINFLEVYCYIEFMQSVFNCFYVSRCSPTFTASGSTYT